MSSVKRDYYEVLSVSRTASGDEIKRAYRRLAMKYHPDRQADADKGTAEMHFKECAEAYEVLSDPERRQRYDQYGHAGLNGQHDFSNMDVGDIFSMFDEIFGGGRGGRGRGRPARGFDLETQVELTLTEIASGVEKTIEFERQSACETCHGSGAKPGTKPTACVACGGSGRVAQQGFGGMFRMVTACPNCRGKGSIVRDHCPDCSGTGKRPVKRVISVKIPAGVHEGQAVRVVGEGEPGEPGSPPGDLHVYVAVKQHPFFTRHGNDLVCQVPLSFTQAAMGGKVKVPTLDGFDELEVSAGTQHGEVFKFKGKGLPDLRSGRRGDELVQVLIEIPRKLTDRQRKLLEEFAETEDTAVMPGKKSFLDKLKDLFD